MGDPAKARLDDVYVLRPATTAPVVLAVAFVVMSIASSPWWLASVPFAALGVRCAQPNLNLVNGFPAYVAMALGLGLINLCRPFEPLGLAVLAGSASGFYLDAIEKRIHAVKYVDVFPDSTNSDRHA